MFSYQNYHLFYSDYPNSEFFSINNHLQLVRSNFNLSFWASMATAV